MEDDADEGHAWSLREGQFHGADPEDPNWSDGFGKEQVQGARWTMLRRKDEEVGENSVACGLEGSKAQERVQFVISVNKDEVVETWSR